jgi:carbon-monoxide dehydrogenase large subunit
MLTGRGRYVDDVQLPNLLHAAFVRSPFPHARILSIETGAALDSPGVAAVLTGEDMRSASNPITSMFAGGAKWPVFGPLPADKVRFVGDLVAMVVAESRYQAEDACELVMVDYDPLPAVAGFGDALDPRSPPLFEELGDNVLLVNPPVTYGDVDAAFAEADRVVTATLQQHRVANVPMETRGAVADYDPSSGELTFYASTQTPHGLRMQLASTIGHPMERLRVLNSDVGGSFGLKGGVYREDFCVALATRQLHRPVKWIEDRAEHLLASGHAREETVEAEFAVKDDGTLLGIKAKLILDAGAYPRVPVPATRFPDIIQRMLPGPYRLKGYRFESTVVATNKASYVAYRGPWAMETWVRERMLDIVADELSMAPAEIRRKNMVAGDREDRLITGFSLAGVSSRTSLDRALELIDYDAFRTEQVAARAEGRYLGVGFATFIEASPGPTELRRGAGPFSSERAKVSLQPDGHLVVITSQAPQGQSHETTLAQVAADEMGVPLEDVRVLHGDTRYTPFSPIGTGGSRAAIYASGAVMVTTRQVKDQVLAIAGELLEISPADLEIVNGVVRAKGVPQKSIPLGEIAMKSLFDSANLPAGVDGPLEADERFTPERVTSSGWSGGTHGCTVEVDLSTGAVKILRYLVVEDCGRVINPAIVEGQVHGGVAQGIGEVLYERAAYDPSGNFLAGSFMDYLLPTSAEIPTIEIDHLESGADDEFGFRGIGEGGAIVAPATLTNAIADALRPFGSRVCEQFLPPERILGLAGAMPRNDR